MRVAFLSIALNTGSRSPGELEMTRSTSDVAACCSRASLSSRVRSASFFSNAAAREPRIRSTRVLTFVLVERTLRLRFSLFGPLRDKTTPPTAVAPCCRLRATLPIIGRIARSGPVVVFLERHAADRATLNVTALPWRHGVPGMRWFGIARVLPLAKSIAGGSRARERQPARFEN
jgi:hypothetical protein